MAMKDDFFEVSVTYESPLVMCEFLRSHVRNQTVVPEVRAPLLVPVS